MMAFIFLMHAIDIFKALDFILFDAMKSITKTARGDLGDHSIRDHIIKLLQAYEQVAMSFTIRSAFRKT
jgi:hypothetical protein